MVAVMEWIEMTSKTQFTAREARAHKKLRPLFATADAIKAVLETLVEYGLLIRIHDDTYERSPIDPCGHCGSWFVALTTKTAVVAPWRATTQGLQR